jgi:5'-nucleotidase
MTNTNLLHRLATLISLTSLALCAACSAVQTSSAPIELHIVALNDLHGYLDTQKFTYKSGADKKVINVNGAGIANLGAYLKEWRREDPQLLLLAGGDIVGGSPMISSQWADEPSIVAMNLLGLRASAVGNHEFDHGQAELQRLQDGGCKTDAKVENACKWTGAYTGAKFPYLGANVINIATGQPAFAPYRIEEVQGVKIAFLGAVDKGTPSMVMAGNLNGLRFEDEAEAVNRHIPALRAQGVTVFVLLIHAGGRTDEADDEPSCINLKGGIVHISKRLDPAIRLVVSAHSHVPYTCMVEGRMVTQAGRFGQVLTRATLTIDPQTRQVREVKARNVVVTATDLPPEPALVSLLADVRARNEQTEKAPVARLAFETVWRQTNKAGESALGDLVADARLAAMRPFGAQIVLLNSSGVRGDLHTGPEMKTTLAFLATVLPFGNRLVVMNLTGAQLRALLEQQNFPSAPDGTPGGILQVSEGLTYSWDHRRPAGQHVIPETLRLNGKAIDDQANYRIGVDDFLAGGALGLSVLKQGSDRVDTGIVDLQTLRDYVIARDAGGNPAGFKEAQGRITRVQ